jgi:hypothetical protein
MGIRLARTIVSQMNPRQLQTVEREAYQIPEKPNAFGSMTFGGYDQSRFVPNNVTFPFDANDSRKPSLNIQSIVTTDMNDETVGFLNEGPAYTLVDFAESHIWLPAAACDGFAKAFNLTYDNNTDLYLVDPSTHARLVERNPSITFGLGQTSDPRERVNVVLPYSAFDQQASYPIYKNATNYFPIRRAYNDTQYTLGRTFFQEAYIRIDYERGNFSIHQALFPTTDDKQQIVTVRSPDKSVHARQTARLSRGAIVGISLGGIAFFVAMVVLGFWMYRWRKKTKEQGKPVIEVKRVECEDQPKVETDGTAFYEAEGVAFYEKDGCSFAEMEGHIFPELYFPEPIADAGEVGVRTSRTDLSTIFELYEAGGNERFSFEESPELRVPEKAWPPPGWI